MYKLYTERHAGAQCAGTADMHAMASHHSSEDAFTLPTSCHLKQGDRQALKVIPAAGVVTMQGAY